MKKDDLYQRLRANPHPVVLDVWAPWCLPCRTISPALERLGQQYAGRVDVWKLNADENTELVRELEVLGIPTLIVFQGEREILRQTGAQPQAVLARLFEAALSGSVPAARGPAPMDRLVRGAAGITLLALGWAAGPSLLLFLAGGAILFSAVYDRCPVWRAISPRLMKVLRRS